MSKKIDPAFYAKALRVDKSKVLNLTEAVNSPLPENCVHFTLPIIVAVPVAGTDKVSIQCPVISVDKTTKQVVEETFRSTNGFMFPVVKPFMGCRYPKPEHKIHRFGAEFAKARSHYQVATIGSKGFQSTVKMDLAVPSYINGKQEFLRESGEVNEMDFNSPIAKVANTTMYETISSPETVADKAVVKAAYEEILSKLSGAVGEEQMKWVADNKADIWFLN